MQPILAERSTRAWQRYKQIKTELLVYTTILSFFGIFNITGLALLHAVLPYHVVNNSMVIFMFYKMTAERECFSPLPVIFHY